MSISIFAAFFALQATTIATPEPAPESVGDAAPWITSLDELPIEQVAGPRCGVAFAVVSRWQKSGDARGNGYIDMETEGGREFFIRSMANLMVETGLDRDQLQELAFAEVTRLDSPEGAERVASMMPACLLLKQSAGL